MKAAELAKKLGSKKQKTIGELKQNIATHSDQNQNFCLFLGSGASRTSGIRTAGEMVQEWRKSVYADLSGNEAECEEDKIKSWLVEHCGDWYNERQEYSSFIERRFPLRTNRRKFIESEVADKIPSIGYAYLVRLAEAGFLRTIFTTNFDDLLNEAFYQLSSERALVCAHDSFVNSISVTSTRAKIIKLHGDYLYDALKNTTKETQSLDVNMKEKLREFLKEYGLIIAGYSGSDKSITRILLDMLDEEIYLQNGLYWCFRETDEVSDGALEILSRDKSFYVISPGFDEFMADLYTVLPSNATPFSSKLASDRAANIIESYLKNDVLKFSKSPIIRKHLEALEAEKNASFVFDILNELNADRIASSGLSDKNFAVYLEIERALKSRNLEDALKRLAQELAKATERRFKEILLHRLYICSLRLNRFDEAKQAVKEMLEIEPANYYVALSECSLFEKRAERVEYLERLRGRHPYSAPVLNQFAEELSESIEKGDKLKGTFRAETVISTLQASITSDPSLSNPAWSQLFTIYAKQKANASTRELLEKLVDKHLEQDPYDSRTSRLLLRYCRKFKTVKYKERPLFDFLQGAYSNHFPRDYVEHLEVFVDACIEFDAHRFLRPILEEAISNEDLKRDPDFAILMMNVHYDVFRDLTGAIAYAREFLRTNKKPSVEMRLVELYLYNNQPQKAREWSLKLKGAIDQTRWLRLESKILEHEGRYQDAIDVIDSIPDRREFDERFTSILSYLELKMKSPARALKRCKVFLEERAFSPRFEAEIINYEYSKLLDKRNLDKKRIDGVREYTDSETVKAVCCSLLDQDKDAIAILKKEGEKRFSEFDEWLQWPVISRHEKQLRMIRDELAKGKRSLGDLPKIEEDTDVASESSLVGDNLI